MQLTFEHSQKVCDGHQPAGFHAPDNVLQVLFVGADGRPYGVETNTPHGDFKDREFTDEHRVGNDESVQFLRVTYLPRVNLWVTWLTGQLHRMSVFILKQDISDYLADGNITFQKDDPGATLSLTLENPRGIIAAEDMTSAPPGSRINVWFKLGDSAKIQIGIFYVDRIKMSVGNPKVQINARNAIGKLLKEQTFDEKTIYAPKLLHLLIQEILEDASVVASHVETSEITMGMQFPPDMTYYEGIMEILNSVPGWKIREQYNGEIIIGSPTYHRFTDGVYSFVRDTDCFSRDIDRMDKDVFAKVCVHYTETFEVATGTEDVVTENIGVGLNPPAELVMNTTNKPVAWWSEVVRWGGADKIRDLHYSIDYANGRVTTLDGYHPDTDQTVSITYNITGTQTMEIKLDHYVYRDVVFQSGWNLPRNKTFYFSVPDGTTQSEAEAIADELAEKMANIGLIESFAGPIRPQLQPSDETFITEPGKIARTIGVVTQVGHAFGKSGFYTDFTVDSGGVLRKPMIKDFIEQISKKKEQGSAKRL